MLSWALLSVSGTASFVSAAGVVNPAGGSIEAGGEFIESV